MNVNPSSEQFGEVVPWDSLTDEQKASGDWIELPDVSNEPRRARKRTASDDLRAMFASVSDEAIARELPGIFANILGEFDALGRPK